MPGGSARGRYMHGLNCRNVGGSHTPGNHTAESTLPGWGDRTRTRKCRFKNRYLKYRPNSLVFWNIFGPETFRGRREETAMRLGIQTRQLTKPMPKMVEGPPGCPGGPSITCSSSTLAGDFGPLHRGPISRPYPTREPLLIGAPRAGSAEPTDGQAIAASGTTIRNCIQWQQETTKLCPRYSTFAQHPPRLSRDTLLSRSRCGLAAVGPRLTSSAS